VFSQFVHGNVRARVVLDGCVRIMKAAQAVSGPFRTRKENDTVQHVAVGKPINLPHCEEMHLLQAKTLAATPSHCDGMEVAQC